MNDKNLAESEYVKQLIDIFKRNSLDSDAKGLAEVVGYVTAVQADINKAVSDVAALSRELADMHEERNHPVRTMLQKAANGLSSRLEKIQGSLDKLKGKIIAFCKRAVEAFKDQGVHSLYGAVTDFGVKRDIESLQNSLGDTIKYNQDRIARIEAMSTELHAAGRAIRNIGRAIKGKELIPDIKPNGKLARLIESPLNTRIKLLRHSLVCAAKMLEQIDRLEKAAALRQSRSRPSTLEDIRTRQARLAEQTREAPPKARTAEAER